MIKFNNTIYFVILFGIILGMGGFTFHYGEGASYLSNDPAACANCHIMKSHLNAWHKSTHHAVATCNDCHAPHDSLLSKLYCKGRNGFFHSLAFTIGNFPEPLRITDYNRFITEDACRSCHADITYAIDTHPTINSEVRLSCIRCHSSVGHPR
ncbi:cytochrome c nitrite reductase small subunit [Candidatus Scalindua japonica]|uniref:cytochrome c nitrite reductase small subunit n=1 Tax=Candidatus Scalindua japonica TaxID=1284222 RepID=UPI000BDF6D73|nr:cytochrome c nitrite reductase small subunit [Candidatus Scalindua japonica]